MRSTTTLLQALFATSALAIQITSPKKDDVVALNSGVQVTWSTVSTDAKSAHLVLVNMASGHTPYQKDLGEVDLTKGSVIVSEDDVPNDSTFQFNLQSVVSQNAGILAQSEQFENKNAPEDNKSTKSAAAQQTTAAASTLVTASDSAAATVSASGSDSKSSAVSVSGASTMATVTGSATTTASGTASKTAAPTGAAGKVQSGSLLALAVGIAAVLA
ncbi:hypothetical protein N0V85_003965 [Neurospora sp. IMI 360204]|nr:hypothetical protein N0V85_003965 [Neurospora sp. IMI 360204]